MKMQRVVSPRPVAGSHPLRGVSPSLLSGQTPFLDRPGSAAGRTSGGRGAARPCRSADFLVGRTFRRPWRWASGGVAVLLAVRLNAAEVVHWGEATDPVWPLDSVPELTNVVAVAAGNRYSLFLRADGSVWGVPFLEWWLPSATLLASNSITALEVGGTELAIQTDGRVVALRGTPELPPDLTNIVAVAKGSAHRLALRRDGTVPAWGYNASGQTNVPPGLSNVVAIAAGWNHNLALLSDGTVTAWGDNSYGQTSVPEGLSQVVAGAAGRRHSLALLADGTVTAWGAVADTYLRVPDGLSNVVAQAAGARHNLAVREDGSLVLWGSEPSGHLYPPPEARSNVLAVTTSDYQSLALLDGPPDAAPPLFIGSPFLMGTVSHPFRPRLLARYRPGGFQAENLPAGLSWTRPAAC